ncbi:(2Fe-2S) ferredoxin domain-containing protein [Phormidesmis sp. 146-35]
MTHLQVLVCQYQNCLEKDSAEVLAAFLAHPISNVTVIESGCQGQCNMGVTVRVLPDEVWYCRVKPEQVETIVEQHLKQGKPVEDLLHPRFHPRF